MFQANHAVREFSNARGFREFFEFNRLIQGKFSHREAADLGKMGAAPEFVPHFVGQRTNIGAR